jgi:hypothetical protein
MSPFISVITVPLPPKAAKAAGAEINLEATLGLAEALPALVAWTDVPEMLPGVNPRIVPIVPMDPNGVAADRFNIEHLQSWFEHRKRGRIRFRMTGPLRLSTVCPGAGGAGTFVSQQAKWIGTVVPIAPVDLDALRLRDGNVLRID